MVLRELKQGIVKNFLAGLVKQSALKNFEGLFNLHERLKRGIVDPMTIANYYNDSS